MTFATSSLLISKELDYVKIARTIPNFYPYVTGPANQAFQISKRLSLRGVDSLILTSDYKARDSPKSEIIDGIAVKRLHVPASFMQYSRTPSLMQELVNYNPSLVHAHSYRNYQTECVFKYSARMNKPYVISMHGTALGYKFLVNSRIRKLPYSQYDRFIGLKQLRKASTLIVNTSQEESELRALLGDDLPKVETIPVGIEAKKIPEKSQGGQNILFVARITRDRDPKVLIHALKDVISEFPSVHLNIVGGETTRSNALAGGVIRRAKILTSKLGLEKSVSFLGELHGHSLKSAYESADIFVYQTLWENFGQVVLEAASYGLPIVSCNTGVARDLIVNGENGFVVPVTNNEENFAQKIKILLGDPKRRLQFSTRIRRKALQDYSWDEIMDKYEKLYCQLAS